MWIVLPLAALLAGWVLLLLDVEPVPTWFYVFAWYPTLALLDGLATRLDRRPRLLTNVRLVLSLLWWSPVIWLFFEAINFRLRNWYYVYLPDSLPARWTGIMLSFATVVPAVVLAERLLAAAGVGHRWRSRPIRLGVRRARHLSVIGAVMLLAVLVFPDWLFPLTWAAVLLIADPLVYRRRIAWSLIADLERGDWGRVARLMLGGLLIGGLWEGYNFLARGKWIYTVPLLERLKWFEMPPLGFVGFPFFALEAWAMYHALCVLGVAFPVPDERGRTEAAPRGRERRRPFSIPLAVGGAMVFSLITLIAMERQTISSTVPVIHFRAAPELTSPWQIATLDAPTLAIRAGVSTDSARAMLDYVRLATLKGIGTEHATQLALLGVRRVCELARSDAEQIWRRIHERSGARVRPTEAEVRVWIRAAQHACGR